MRTIWERFDEKWVEDPSTGCWLWMGSTHWKGYGQFRVGRMVLYAHRVAYELRVGLIPADLTIDHLCRVRCCVNPAHMEAVTIEENIGRGVRTRRAALSR